MVKPLAARVARTRASETVRISNLVAEKKRAGIDVVSFSVGEPDFDTPKHVREAAKKALDAGHTHYTPSAGIPELRQAVAAKHRRENAMDETTPDDVQAIQLIADLLSREGRDEEAEAYLQKLPEDTKLPPDMLLNVGIRLYNEQKYDQALENFNRVVAQNPDLPEAYYYRGLVYLSREANAQARADFEKLIELAPDSQQATEAREFLTYLEPGSR